MFLRVIPFLLVLVLCNSCDRLTWFDSSKMEPLDTIVDFSVVDLSPSFKACDSIINKARKSFCFRNTIHQKINHELTQHSFTIKEAISEVVFVDLLISAQGVISLEKIESSEKIKKELPALLGLLQKSVAKLPTVKSAIKQGIPVTTKYRLPIKIQLKE